MERYCTARFERGMGFGNRLFPWARCHLHSREHAVPMLAPRWWWPPRVQPLLRELPPPTELPGHLFLRGLRNLPEYIGGARRLMIETTSPRDIRVFRGEAGKFNDLVAKQGVLLDALQRMSTHPPQSRGEYMAAHVRRGDFAKGEASELLTRGGVRTPTSWFVDSLRAVRAATGDALPLMVVSDGRAADLKELLAEPNVYLVRSGAPLGDLLVLAGARALLASGSSFSAWAAFLGGMPTATHPGQSVTWFGVPIRSWIGEFDPAADDDGFVRAVVASPDHLFRAHERPV